MNDENKTEINISPQRILIIKLSSLGDIVHTLPAVAALRQRFPSAHLCWLVKTQWTSILEENPDIDELLSVEVSWKNWLTIIKDIRQKQFDLVIDFQGLFRTGFLGIVSGANVRIGFAQAREGAPWMYTHRVSLPRDQECSWRLLGIHAVDRNLAIARYLGAKVSDPVFHLPGSAEDHIFIQDLLHGFEVDNHESLIALAPWSRSALKSWPLNHFVQLAEELMRGRSWRVVLLGGPADIQTATEFRYLESQGLINLVGKLSLRQLPELLRKMKLLIGNDSSLIHLAAGVGTRVLGIFGPTEPKATGPYPISRHVVQRTELFCSPCGQRTCSNINKMECLNTISVSSVFEGAQQ